MINFVVLDGKETRARAQRTRTKRGTPAPSRPVAPLSCTPWADEARRACAQFGGPLSRCKRIAGRGRGRSVDASTGRGFAMVPTVSPLRWPRSSSVCNCAHAYSKSAFRGRILLDVPVTPARRIGGVSRVGATRRAPSARAALRHPQLFYPQSPAGQSVGCALKTHRIAAHCSATPRHGVDTIRTDQTL